MQFTITIACFAHTNDVATGYTNTKHALIASAELAYHPKQQLKRLNILTVSVAVFYKKKSSENVHVGADVIVTMSREMHKISSLICGKNSTEHSIGLYS